LNHIVLFEPTTGGATGLQDFPQRRVAAPPARGYARPGGHIENAA